MIILATRHGLLRPCLSDAILEEYAEVLARPKFDFPHDEIAALLAMLRDQGGADPARRSGAVAARSG